MKMTRIACAFIGLTLFGTGQVQANSLGEPTIRQVLPLTTWQFSLDDSHWQTIEVPHDWAIDKPFDMRIDRGGHYTGSTGALPASGIGCYHTVIPANSFPEGKRIRIEFDGAMSRTTLYLNGDSIGQHVYGYTSFAFDLTRHWNDKGENTLLVRVENKPNAGRWYTGAGLYRQVRLVATAPVSVAYQGTTVTTPKVSARASEVKVVTHIVNHTDQPQRVVLESSLIDPAGKVIASRRMKQEAVCGANTDDVTAFSQSFTVKQPALWSIETPSMYQLRSRVYVDNVLTDTYTTPFGIRSIRFDKDTGFFLNDKPVKLQGVCLHHDLGALGAAVNVRAIERQLRMMKEMGSNAIRTSHNPPAPEVIDLCDRLGLLVIEEAFDIWRMGKSQNDYHRYFDEWAEHDLTLMIHRDRNHPSIIMWSIGNEVREQQQKEGGAIARMLTDICHREDPTRPVTLAVNNLQEAIDNGLTDAVDIVGLNYKPRDYEQLHKEHPEYILYASESASTVSSRGTYYFPAVEVRDVYHHDYHTSSYDMEYPAWASTPDTEFEKQDDCPFILGEFVWTGFDYLGEPTPYGMDAPARSSYFGIVDLAGMKKDRFYLYQSKWSNRPVLHLLPHWNWEERIGKTVPVFCYTNYPQAELFVNGKSMGIRKKGLTNQYTRYRLMWQDVMYHPGEIYVVAYDEKGVPADTVSIRTAGEPYALRATPDRSILHANRHDLSYVEVEVVDKEGNLCPRANQLLFFDVEGAAALKAACNGDPTDQTAFSSAYMRTFNGKLMLIMEAGKVKGDGTLSVYGGRLKPTTVSIKVE
jgi:beta-galactosidase